MQYNLVQCELKKNNSSIISFIPERFAILNSFVMLKNLEGVWDNGWQVKSCGRSCSNSDLALKVNADRLQRKASDIPGFGDLNKRKKKS